MSLHSLVVTPGNTKLGNVVKTYSTKDTCPKTCPFLKSGCFGENFPQVLHWDKVHKTGQSLATLIHDMGQLPLHTKTRINIVGDHITDMFGNICTETLKKYSQVVTRRLLKVLNYTHYPLNIQNIIAAKTASFVINFSTERINQAAYAIESGVNAVLTLPSTTDFKVKKYDNLTVMVCPANYRKVTCEQCMLCAQDRVKRKIVIGFIAHGTKKTQINKALVKANNWQLDLEKNTHPFYD